MAFDTVEENRKLATETLGFKRAVADCRDVLNDPEVDVVSICSPNFLRHEMGIAAAEAGKTFWIEKPMGVLRSSPRRLLRLQRSRALSPR